MRKLFRMKKIDEVAELQADFGMTNEGESDIELPDDFGMTIEN